jgi:hypothetical protein
LQIFSADGASVFCKKDVFEKLQKSVKKHGLKNRDFGQK